MARKVDFKNLVFLLNLAKYNLSALPSLLFTVVLRRRNT